MFKFNLGDIVKSDVTGFKGVNMSNAVHMNGCNRCWVQPKVDKDGKDMNGSWIDEPELVLVAKSKIKREKKEVKPGGFSSQIK